MSTVLIPDYKKPIIPGGSFTWHEYAWMPRLGKYAVPTLEQYENAIVLFAHVQEFIRNPLERPLIITGGARTAEYTEYLRKHGTPAALRGAHNDWAAVDLAAPAGMTNSEFWAVCNSQWPGRMEQLAYTPTWVHLDIRQWGERVRFKP